MDLIEFKKLQAYRIADQFLRLKKAEVLTLRNSGEVASETQELGFTAGERLRDFIYFYDFYLISGALILGLTFAIFYF